jgi:hypothetical protein
MLIRLLSHHASSIVWAVLVPALGLGWGLPKFP